MGMKQVCVCDACGKELAGSWHGYSFKADAFKIIAETERFWDGVEMDQFFEKTEYCETCVRNIVKLLERIANRLEAASNAEVQQSFL